VARSLAILGATAAVTLCAQNQSTFYAAYEDGLEAMAAGRWRTAAAALERAVKLRPEPGTRVIIYGNNLLPEYYPYSQLARCYLELGEGDHAGALLRKAEALKEPAALREPIARRLAHQPEAPQRPEPKPAPRQEPRPSPPAEAPPAPRPDPAHQPEAAPNQAQPVPGAMALPVPALPQPAPAGLPEPAPPRAEAPTAPTPAVQPVVPPAPVPIRPLPRAFLPLLAALAAALAALVWFRRRSRRQPPAPARTVTMPDTVGPYHILRILGQGGFATTYLARHGGTGREVALKVLHAHRRHDPDFTRRFTQEARLGTLLDHPRLVRLLDPGPEDGATWIAMEYVPGPTLQAWLAEHGPLPVAEAVTIALAVAEAMAYAHTRGVVHRDLKPGNVIMGARGPMVMDLGIARDLGSSDLTTTFSFLGTPQYAPPEAQLLAKAGPPSDRYSLGVILFEMLAGHPPFTGETPFAILDQHRSAPAPDLQGVPPELALLVRRLLHKDPESRPEDGELLAKLRAILDGLRTP